MPVTNVSYTKHRKEGPGLDRPATVHRGSSGTRADTGVGTRRGGPIADTHGEGPGKRKESEMMVHTQRGSRGATISASAGRVWLMPSSL